MRRLAAVAIILCSVLMFSTAASATQIGAGFGTNGVATFRAAGTFVEDLRIARQSSGKFIVSYKTELAIGPLAIVTRLNADGTVDTSFGTNGSVQVIQPLNSSRFTDMALDSTGRILLAGRSSDGTTGDSGVLVARLTADGLFDTTFDGDGFAIHDVSSDFREIYALYIDTAASDAIYLAGTRDISEGVVYKLTNAGALDNGFSGDGSLEINAGGSEIMSGLTKDAGGRIVASGYITDSQNALLARFNTSGVLDNTFSGNGLFDFDYNNFNSTFGHLEIASDASSNIYLVGETLPDVLVARVTGTGVLDNAFSGDGLTALTGFSGAGNDFAQALVLDASGRPIVAGEVNFDFDGEFGLFRFTTGGVLDSGFGAGGKFGVDILGFGDSAQDALLVGTDLYMAGFAGATTFDSVTSPSLIAVVKIDTVNGTDGGNDLVPMNVNTGFEQAGTTGATANGWKGTNIVGDKRICDKPAQGVFFSYAGNCAFRFQGSATEKAALKATVSNFGSTIIDQGAQLGYNLMIKSTGQVNLKVKFKLVHTGGGASVPIVQSFNTPSPQYTRHSAGGFTAVADSMKVVIIINNKSLTGKVSLDNVIFWVIEPFFGSSRAALAVPDAPVLPVPEPAN